MKPALLALALGVLICASQGRGAQAGEVVTLAQQAEADAKAGKHMEAYEAIRSATLKVWNGGPLFFRKALFVAQSPTGFGLYQPRPANVFKPGEQLIIYAEPVGFKWEPKDGLNHALLVADLILRTEDGKVVAGQKNFGSFKFDSHEQNTEVMAVLTIDFTGAPPGKYVVDCTFTDKMSGKTASLELPFEIK